MQHEHHLKHDRNVQVSLSSHDSCPPTYVSTCMTPFKKEKENRTVEVKVPKKKKETKHFFRRSPSPAWERQAGATSIWHALRSCDHHRRSYCYRDWASGLSWSHLRAGWNPIWVVCRTPGVAGDLNVRVAARRRRFSHFSQKQMQSRSHRCVSIWCFDVLVRWKKKQQHYISHSATVSLVFLPVPTASNKIQSGENSAHS